MVVKTTTELENTVADISVSYTDTKRLVEQRRLSFPMPARLDPDNA
jgi:hypothetical protein